MTAPAPRAPSAPSDKHEWPSRRKFRKGAAVLGALEAVRAIQEGLWLYFNDKPMHPAVMRNWSVAQLSIQTKYGRIRYAILNEPPPTLAKPADNDLEFAEVE